MTKLDSADWALLELRGVGGADFLQGYLTCDLDELRHTDTLLAAACNASGKVIATMLVMELSGLKARTTDENSHLLFLPTHIISSLREEWEKYFPLYPKLKLLRYSGNFGIFTQAKPQLSAKAKRHNKLGRHDKAAKPAKSATGTNLPDSKRLLNLAYLHFLPTPPKIHYKSQEEELRAHKPPQILVSSKDSWNACLVKAGIPCISKVLSGKLTPQMLSYDKLNGVSFTKGCYLGQEVVARVHYKGRSARSCYKVNFQVAQRDVVIGGTIYTEAAGELNELGRLISYYVRDSRGSCYGLAVLNNNLGEEQSLMLNSKPLQIIAAA